MTTDLQPTTARAPAPRSSALTCDPVGSVLLAHPVGVPSDAAVELARALPAERGRTVVVVDPAAGDDPELTVRLAALLPAGRPVRLVLSRAGSGGAGAMANLLAERLRTEVVAPDGVLRQVPGGSVFVLADGGSGRWLWFRPGEPPRQGGNRFPEPAWESGLPPHAVKIGTSLVVEPIPAGLWLHHGALGAPPSLLDLPCEAGTLTVVVGGPNSRAVAVSEICHLVEALPAVARALVALAPYGTHQRGDDSLGQLVADALDGPVAVRAGVSTVDGVITADGRPGWWPFATVLGYWPRRVPMPGVPKVLRYRAPLPGLDEIRPGAFRLTDTVAVEVVQSGLWVRTAGEPVDGSEVRAVPLDPGHARITVGEPGRDRPGELTEAAADLVRHLDPLTRRAVRLVFAPSEQDEEEARSEELPPGSLAAQLAGEPAAPATPEPATPEPKPTDEPPPVDDPASVGEPASADELASVSEPRTADEPEPAEEPGSDRITRDHHSEPREREWLRRTLGSRYDGYAGAVTRLLANWPGPRADEDGQDAVVTDLVAVRVYAEAVDQGFDRAQRTGHLGAFRPYAGCVVSGLRRLPSYRGPVLCSAEVDPELWEQYRPGAILTEDGFLHALATPFVSLPGNVEFLVWALTARRIEMFTDAEGPEYRRVIFPPGGRFKVLAVHEITGGNLPATHRVLLREVIREEPDGRDASTLDRLSSMAANRDAVPTHQQQSLDNPGRFHHAIGLR
ncbi:hypothetical protein [Streptoalloteichus hindustanus]|uniref:Uncharacterized protein n=1 Tax=Streptoalloteichus hindustanus TaxID=2017 RepID=A0A1M5PWQ4_STRHI|nr:hypothetical protein [Streptoalloteichus hindustanus]SHH05683.1 hypothetical protein SAMN05444320_12011 [Streptoalloteichus hindustanus]